MRLRIGDRTYTGAAIDLRDQTARDSGPGAREFDGHSATGSTSTTTTRIRTVPATTLATRIATAVEATGCVSVRAERPDGEVAIDLDCPDPTPALGPLRTHPVDGPLRTVLAAAARSRGHTASVADAIADRREDLRELAVPDVALDAARERLAAATGEEERLKERVAALRGELRAHRELGAGADTDVDAVREELTDATTALSAAETERIAAEQALDRAVERAREARDARERQLELEDVIANLERDARRELADEIYPTVRDALEAVPQADPDLAGDSPGSFAGDVASVALAAVRVAAPDAPVVLGPAVDRFESAAAAHDVLDCPVVRV